MDIEFQGLEFPLTSGRTELTIGGGGDDDIYVPDFSEKAFRLKVEPIAETGNSQSRILLEHVVEGAENQDRIPLPGVVSINGKTVGQELLKDGAKITVQNANAPPDEIIYKHAQSGFRPRATLSSGGRDFEISARKTKIVKWELQIFALPSQKVYRFTPSEGGGPIGDTPAPLPLSPLKSVLISNPDKNDFAEVALLIQDRSVSLRQPGKPEEIRAPFLSPMEVPDHASLVFRQLVGDPPRLARRLALSEISIRSEKTYGPQSLSIKFTNPRRKFLELNKEARSFALQSPLLLKEGDRMVRFPEIKSQSSEIAGRVTLGENSFQLDTPWGNRKGLPYGKPFTLGEEKRATLKIDKPHPPAGVYASLAAAALLIILYGRPLLADTRHLALLGGVVVLTCARLVFAYAATKRPAFDDEALALAQYTLLFLPCLILVLARFFEWIAQASRPAGGTGFVTILVTLAAAAVAALPLWEVSHAKALVALASFLPLVVAGLLYYVEPRRLRRPWDWLGGWLLPVVAALSLYRIGESRLRKRWDGIGDWFANLAYWKLLLAIVLFYGARLIAASFGLKEEGRLLGERFPLALLYVPLYILLFSLACARFWQGAKEKNWDVKELWDFFLFAVILTGAHFGVCGVLISDLGMTLYVATTCLLLAAIGLYGLRRPLTWDLPFVSAFLLFPVALCTFFLMAPRPLLAAFEQVSDMEVYGNKLEDPGAIIKDMQKLRLLQFIDRGKLVELGTKSSEAIAQHLAIMDDYTGRGIFGAGFLKVPIVSSVRETSLSDNVASVYLLAQFGGLGALGILLAYAAVLFSAAAFPEVCTTSQTVWRRFGWTLAILSATTFSLVSLYMLAANCQLLPLTGRNMYLLGLNSVGDIWESAILVAFIVTGVAMSKGRPA